MDKRRSIEVSGVKHVNPIPSASRRGPFVVSGAISGADPETGKVPADLDAQCRQMFDNVRRIMVAAGGGPEDIIKMNVWIADRKLRETMNRHCSPTRIRGRPATRSRMPISPRRCRSNAICSR